MSAAADKPVVLHVSPHPDDELIGAPATLMALQDQGGYHVVNLAISLGRDQQSERRSEELVEASKRAGFELELVRPAIGISRGDNLAAAEKRVRAEIERVLDERTPNLVLSPWPGDRHHGHEVVARGVREALRNWPDPPVWWMWGLWGALPLPTLFVPFDQGRLEKISHALEAHAGELARNDYRRLVEGRALANAVLGAELVFGFGEPCRGCLYAELLTEVFRRNDGWWLGRRRELTPQKPLEAASDERVDAWVDAGHRMLAVG